MAGTNNALLDKVIAIELMVVEITRLTFPERMVKPCCVSGACGCVELCQRGSFVYSCVFAVRVKPMFRPQVSLLDMTLGVFDLI